MEEAGSVGNNSDITYSWSWTLLEEKPNLQLLKNFPAFYGTRRFITVKKAVFWDMAPCRCCVNRRFGRTYRLHPQGRRKKILFASAHAGSSPADFFFFFFYKWVIFSSLYFMHFYVYLLLLSYLSWSRLFHVYWTGPDMQLWGWGVPGCNENEEASLSSNNFKLRRFVISSYFI
jgi:hypothetical protein